MTQLVLSDIAIGCSVHDFFVFVDKLYDLLDNLEVIRVHDGCKEEGLMIVMCVTSLLTAISCLLWWETNRIYVEIFSRDVDAFQTIVVPNKKLVLILLFFKKNLHMYRT